MDRKRTKRSGMFRAGLAVVFIGALLGITGITAGSAGAQKPLRIKVELCHRTNSTTNPYRVIEVSVDATNGEFVGPDHTGHDGPAFDFTGVRACVSGLSRSYRWNARLPSPSPAAAKIAHSAA